MKMIQVQSHLTISQLLSEARVEMKGETEEKRAKPKIDKTLLTEVVEEVDAVAEAVAVASKPMLKRKMKALRLSEMADLNHKRREVIVSATLTKNHLAEEVAEAEAGVIEEVFKDQVLVREEVSLTLHSPTLGKTESKNDK